MSPSTNFLFPGSTMSRAALAAKARLFHAVDQDADLAAFQDILDVQSCDDFFTAP